MRKVQKRQLEAIWQKVPVSYYEEGVKRNFGQKWWHNCKFMAIVKATAGLSPRKILDIGSNGGFLTAKIAALFPKAETVGIDVYHKAVEYAQEKYPEVKFFTADALKLPFREKEFDLIFCLETLEHLVFPQRALREIRRVLKDDAVAVISMDTGNFLFSLIWFCWTRFGGGKVWLGSHLYHFNQKKLRKMILEEGFNVKMEVVSHLGMGIVFKIGKK